MYGTLWNTAIFEVEWGKILAGKNLRVKIGSNVGVILEEKGPKWRKGMEKDENCIFSKTDLYSVGVISLPQMVKKLRIFR